MEDIELVVKGTKELSAQALLKIMKERVKVFVVEQKCPYQEIDDADENAIHIFLKKEERIIAYTRIVLYENQSYVSFGRVLVVKQYRNLKLGRKIVKATLSQIQKQYPGKSVKIQAQSYLQKFYSSFGFEPISDVYLEDNIPHIDMYLKKDS